MNCEVPHYHSNNVMTSARGNGSLVSNDDVKADGGISINAEVYRSSQYAHIQQNSAKLIGWSSTVWILIFLVCSKSSSVVNFLQ